MSDELFPRNSKPQLPDAFWAELAAENPLGERLTAQDVRDWFDLVWLTYRDHGYTQHRRAITRWWSRVRRDELERSRERVATIRENAEADRLRAVEHELRTQAAPVAGENVIALRRAR